MALLFVKYLPDWTLWALLGLLCLWDIFAVLCPFGPLRILTRLMDKRGDRDIPGLLYTGETRRCCDSRFSHYYNSNSDHDGKRERETRVYRHGETPLEVRKHEHRQQHAAANNNNRV